MGRGLKAKSLVEGQGLWVLLAKQIWQVNDSQFRAVSAHCSFPVVPHTEQP